MKKVNWCAKMLLGDKEYFNINLSFSKRKNADLRVIFDFINGNTQHGYNKTITTILNQKEAGKMAKSEYINILDAAKFVIQLYYKTQQKYHCSLTKVEKILAISNLVAMRDGTELFADKIYSHDCGVGFPVLNNFVYSDIIEGQSEGKRHIDDEFIEDEKLIPRFYKIDPKVIFPEYAKNIIIDVFRHFGDYSAKDLGLSFNKFKNEILSEVDSNGDYIIDICKTKNFFSNLNEKYSDSIIYNFVYTYPMVNYDK